MAVRLYFASIEFPRRKWTFWMKPSNASALLEEGVLPHLYPLHLPLGLSLLKWEILVILLIDEYRHNENIKISSKTLRDYDATKHTRNYMVASPAIFATRFPAPCRNGNEYHRQWLPGTTMVLLLIISFDSLRLFCKLAPNYAPGAMMLAISLPKTQFRESESFYSFSPLQIQKRE